MTSPPQSAPIARRLRAWLPQLLRRCSQLCVLAFIAYTALGGAFRNYKLAHNHRRLVTLMQGEVWGFLYGLNEDLLALLGEPYEKSFDFLGMPWAGRVGGVDTADPMMLLSQLSRGVLPTATLWTSAAVAVIVAVLLGKVFCSHLCPMRTLFELGQAMRAGLLRLGLPLPQLRGQGRYGGFVLLGGLMASALSSTAIWIFVLPYASLSVTLFLAISAGTLALGTALVAFGWFLVDALVAPGHFCHALCPTGFLLELLGRRPALRLRRVDPSACPTGCQLCTRACPYGLLPQQGSHRPACDSCGRCARACPSEKLARKFSLPIVTGLVLLFVAATLPTGLAHAHHNKGLPHYGYFANYPQVPTEQYVTISGRWELGATLFNFQGLDRRTADTPNDVKIYLYLYDLEADAAYTGPLSVRIVKDDQTVAVFERLEVDEEAVYATRETLPESGDYALVAHVQGKDVRLPFYVELAGDGPSVFLIGAIVAPVLLVFGLALYGRRRRRRKRSASKTSAAVSAGSKAAVLWLFLANGTLGLPVETLAQAEAAPQEQAERCPVCGMRACTMDHSGAPAGEGAHATMQHYDTADGGQVMVMGGIPLELLLFGMAAVIVLSFVVIEWRGLRPVSSRRINLIKNRRVYLLMRSRWLQAIPQLLTAALLIYLIYAGLGGSRARNIAPVAVWTLWWGGLIFGVLLLGSAWCFICPWDGLANLGSRLRVAARVETLSLKLPFPAALSNMTPAIALFVLLTWLELGFGVTTDPRATAIMGLGMAAAAMVAALLWDGKRFCAHFCPVGRICGIYSNFSPIEIRARNPRTCQVCTTEDCLHGNGRGYPCPTGISLKTIQNATDCTACTECIKSCDKYNVALNLRPFGADLAAGGTDGKASFARSDEAWLALTLLSLTLFHGLSMTPLWENFAPGGQSLLKWMALTLGTPRLLNFSIAMAALTLLPIALYALACFIAARWAGDGTRPGRLFQAYAMSLLPVALAYHLAHNAMHILMEGGAIVPLLSDPLGDGSDHFGTASMHVGSLVGDSVLWTLQVALILIGHLFGLTVAHRIGHRLHASPKAARRSLIPIPAVMVAISLCGLWLMHLDMNMRVGRM
ncbi:MAG: 4Fe-4S binding protein [Myxococcales bacterium]|nr:4Fe-4S binding protein [Myxococcales bacterium]